MHTTTGKKITEINTLFSLTGGKKKILFSGLFNQATLSADIWECLKFLPSGCMLHNDAHSCAVIHN